MFMYTIFVVDAPF